MKKFSKILSVALLVALVLSLGVANAFADGEEAATGNTITMTTSAGHTYAAYQIFTGKLEEVDGSNVLSDIQWGVGVNGTALLAALKADATYGAAFAEANTAADVAKVLGNYASNGTDIAALAKIIGANKTTASATGTTAISGLADGYYLIVDQTVADDMPEGDTYSDFMLEVVDDVDVTAKDTTTTSDKKVKEKNDSTDYTSDWQDAADYDIGDTIPFKLTGTVASDYDKYTTYYFSFHDVQSAGLTFDASSVKVYLGATGDSLIDASKYSVKTSDLTDGCTFEIEFTDLKQVAGVSANSVIRVEYTSTLNENAVIGSLGNQNKSNIEFSNNPNGNQHGKTPEDVVTVFTYGLLVNKFDEDGETALKGAGFTLSKWNGTEYVPVGDEIKGEDMTSFEFKGIDAGQYKLEETTVPTGYNKASDLEFKVVGTYATAGDPPALTALAVTDLEGNALTSWTIDSVTVGEATSKYAQAETGIENHKGSVLPSTGGIGTTIFYVVGGVLVLAAIILLVTKKRMSE